MPLTYSDYTVGWITALPIELAAAQELLDEEHDTLPRKPGDDNAYTFGRIGHHNVILACLPAGQMGTTSAATVAAQMRSTFDLRFGLMVGIGGGVPPVRLGDVVVSLPGRHGGVIQYDMGKTHPDRVEQTGFLSAPPLQLLTAVAKLRAMHLRGLYGFHEPLAKLAASNFSRPQGSDILHNEDGEELERPARVDDNPAVHYGTIASGNQVMKSAARRDAISEEFGGVLCFEMEAAGLMNNFPCLVIRGICDYCDANKNKIWQPYAAAVAAAWTKELLQCVAPAQHAVTMVSTTDLILTGTVGQKTWLTSFAEQYALVTSDGVSMMRAKALIRRITKYDHVRSLNHILARQHQDTTLWILSNDKFLDWLAIEGWKQSVQTPILLLTGKIGSGKTFVLATIARFLLSQAATNHLTLHFFAQNTEHSPLEVFRSFVRQSMEALSRVNKPCPQEVIEEMDREFGADNRVPDLTTLIRYILLPQMECFESVVLLFDGIELFDEASRQQILDGIIHMRRKRCKTFFTCRDARSIREIAHEAPISISLDHGANSGDVESYIDEQLQRLSGPLDTLHQVELRASVKQRLLAKANGMFLWVCLQLELIKSCANATEVKTIINNLPSKLEQVFEQCLLRKHNGKPVCEPKVLRWVSAVCEPLTVPELCEMLAYDSDSALHSRSGVSILRAGADLIVQENDTLVPIHHTVKQYLFSRRLQDLVRARGVFHDLVYQDLIATERETVLEVASLSLRCILEICTGTVTVKQKVQMPTLLDRVPALAKKLFNLRGSSSVQDLALVLPSRPVREPSEVRPFLEYAIRTWPQHTKQIQRSDDLWEHFRNVAFAQNTLQIVQPWTTEDTRRLRSSNTHNRGLLGYAVANGHAALLDLVMHPTLLMPREVFDHALPGNDLLPALHVASKAGYTDVVKTLLTTCDIQVKDINDMTALHHAVHKGHAGIVSLLLAKGADTSMIGRGAVQDAIVVAALKGYSEVVQVLLVDGADVSRKKSTINDALYAASKSGHHEVVQVILDAGGNVDDERSPYRNAVYAAAIYDHPKIMRLLLGAAVDTNSKGCLLALDTAVFSGHTDILELLLDAGVDVNGKVGSKALTTASKEGHIEAVRLLLNAGADVNCRATPQGNALQAASSRGEVEVVKLLLTSGADVDAISRDQQLTALQRAALCGHSEVAKLLLDAGADVNGRVGRAAKFALRAASEGGHSEVVRLLAEHGARDE